MGNALTSEEVAKLLERDRNAVAPIRERYPIPEQKGPIKYHDRHERCMSRRCGSPTHWSFRGVRYCYTHMVERVNEEFNNEGDSSVLQP
jgi:hypothetical protein